MIDAATSATEDVESERTTVGRDMARPTHDNSPLQIPPSPLSIARSSLPPNSAVSTQQPPTSNNVYQASPLQRALTPPTQSRIHHHDHPEPFPTIESSTSHESRTTGDQFRISPQGLASSSPSFSSTTIQIYCAACQGIAHLKESYACTECICGVCRACVDILFSEQGARRKCPRCGSMGGKFKPFQLDFR